MGNMKSATTSIAVLDVGGTYIKCALVQAGRMRETGKIATPRDTQEHFLQAIEAVLSGWTRSTELDGIAISLPGVIDVERRRIRVGGSLLYNNGTDVARWEQRFGLPVEVENDARCSAAAELAFGSMRGVKTGLVLTFGTGIGGGVIVNGRVHQGGHLIAGEISIVFADDFELGSRALLGYIGGVNNIAAEIGERCGTSVTCGERAFELISEGNEEACATFERRCDKIARAFFNFQCLLDPERIAIGGGVSAEPLFIKGIQDAIERLYGTFPIRIPHAEIVACRFGNKANLIGAYLRFAARRGIDLTIDEEGIR